MNGPVLVTGAAGRLGTLMVAGFGDREVVAATRGTLDITDAASVARTVAALRPSLIINCASFNDVDGAEDAATTALQVNTFSVRSLARAADTCGATLVHYSTDFVFDGAGATTPYEETSSPSPQSTYAASKLLGEWFALDVPGAFVLRVESLFGCRPGWTGPRGTLDTIVDGIRNGREIRAFTDRVVTPSYMPDIVSATRYLVEQGAAPGLYHCVNSGQGTWFDVAREAANVLGLAARLTPVTVAQVPMKAQRPTYCALSNRKLAAAGFEMPSWRDALRRWLVDERGSSAGAVQGYGTGGRRRPAEAR